MQYVHTQRRLHSFIFAIFFCGFVCVCVFFLYGRRTCFRSFFAFLFCCARALFSTRGALKRKRNTSPKRAQAEAFARMERSTFLFREMNAIL